MFICTIVCHDDRLGVDIMDGAVMTPDLRESVKCAICLEIMRAPRALICLHTFCEECIQGVVNGTASQGIPCPVCREETPPPGPNVPKIEWAKHLRRNTVILPLIERLNSLPSTSTTRPSSTSQRENNISSDSPENIRPAKIGNGTDVSTNERCAKHPSLSVQYYCSDHFALLCKRCRSEHRRCADVVLLSKREMKERIAESIQEIDVAFQQSLDEITNIKDALEVNMINTRTDIENFPRRVKELQAILNRNLDDLCDTLQRESRDTDNHSKLQTHQIDNCCSLEACIKTYKRELIHIFEHRNVLEQFEACESIKSQLVHVDREVTSARRSMQFCKVRLAAVDVLESLIRLQDDLPKIDCKAFTPDLAE